MTRKQVPWLVLAVILLLITNFGLWLSRTIYNPQKFTELVVKVYKEEEVRTAIASEIVDNTLESRPLVRQVLDEPVISAISGIMGSQTFTSIFERTAERFQRYLTTDNREDVTIEVGQVATFIKSAGTAISPELGSQIPDVTPQTITLVESNSLPDLNKWLKPMMNLAPLTGIASVIILFYLFYKSKDRQLLLKRVSLYFLAGLVLFALLIPYFRAILQGNVANQNAQIIATATYDAFVGTLVAQLLVLALVFLLVYFGGYIISLSKKTDEES